ncbi:MAG: SMP-30/gluconolactonase/LRE family protein [Chloroflexi bacterium]|nr:SMP-30/gluconolactonase/LRE family protein [Chloroflexota bacterium]
MSEWTWELIKEHDSLTEGPVWDGSALVYNECYANTTFKFDPTSKNIEVWRTNTNISNGQNFSRDGRLFNCEGGAKQMTEVHGPDSVTVIANEHDGIPFNAPNDVAIDRSGRVWFTDPNYGDRPTAMDNESIYRVDETDGSWTTTRVTFDTTRPNGLVFSADESILYVAESPNSPISRSQLRAYPVNSDGSLGDHTVLHDFGAGRGIDGMCLTADGNILATAGADSAGPGPMLYLFAPSGRVISTAPTPADSPTNCAFAEDGLAVLYVTFATGHVYRVPNSGLTGHRLYP